ncbi:MAG: hypothetical protein JWO54_294 [Candidatus Saccharibacteria bacterium]|nr:hypothetical protein [Candidatus Saccharibacteria bacterium]
MDYQCPYCGKLTTLTDVHTDQNEQVISLAATRITYGHKIGLTYEAIVCPNPECKQLKLSLTLDSFDNPHGRWESDGTELHKWQLLPESSAKPQPDYIPAAIVEDYTEASRIASLSPKAAATLARRCMQGMIRNFHGITKNTLYEEIDALKGVIPEKQWQAMDALRRVGNIGAHMKNDVNIIINIEPDEVYKLLAFIEYLFEQWYVKSHDDDVKLDAVVALAGIGQVEPEQDVKL